MGRMDLSECVGCFRKSQIPTKQAVNNKQQRTEITLLDHHDQHPYSSIVNFIYISKYLT